MLCSIAVEHFALDKMLQYCVAVNVNDMTCPSKQTNEYAFKFYLYQSFEACRIASGYQESILNSVSRISPLDLSVTSKQAMFHMNKTGTPIHKRYRPNIIVNFISHLQSATQTFSATKASIALFTRAVISLSRVQYLSKCKYTQDY